MRLIPPKLKQIILADPYYQRCARFKEGTCDGRITWEHCWIYGGRQINEVWAIIPLCWYHHLGKGLDKQKNRYLSLKRASVQDLLKYPKKAWLQLIEYLNGIYDK